MEKKLYSWECPYCHIPAKGFKPVLIHEPFDQRCAGCGKVYRRGFHNDKLYITANMETLVKYLCGLALQKADKDKWVKRGMNNRYRTAHQHVKEMLVDRYG